MKSSLRSRLSLSYAALALVLIAGVSVLVNVFFKIQFNRYVSAEQQQYNRDVVSLVEKQYDAGSGGWDLSAVDRIGMNVLHQGVILKITDAGGGVLWDATAQDNSLCMQMMSQISQTMLAQNPNFKGGYVQASYPLAAGSRSIGEAQISYYGPYYYTSNDVRLLDNVNTILVAVAVASLAMALLFGAVMARRISTPISRAARAALEIAKGHYGERIGERSGSREILQLTDAVNHLAESLEKQESLRKRLTADVAHELRTPLATLQSALEAMIDGIWEPNAERLQSCHEELVRIGRLVGDLEKLARVEAENAVLHRSAFDLDELVQTVLHNFETDYRKKGVELRFAGEETPVTADRDKLAQVAVNLLSNALKYTPPGGRVEVEVTGAGQSARLAVKDSGVGIAAEDLPCVFERFYRADPSRNRFTGGSGLGLAIAKAIVEAHGGQISVSSEPGKGSVFTVCLPRADQA